MLPFTLAAGTPSTPCYIGFGATVRFKDQCFTQLVAYMVVNFMELCYIIIEESCSSKAVFDVESDMSVT